MGNHLERYAHRCWYVTCFVWCKVVTSLGYNYPYAIGLLAKNIEVQSLFEGAKFAVQHIPARAKLIKIKGDCIYIAAAKEIWRLVPIPLVEQIDELVRIKSYDEALSLLKHLPAQVGNEDTKVSYFLIQYTQSKEPRIDGTNQTYSLVVRQSFI